MAGCCHQIKDRGANRVFCLRGIWSFHRRTGKFDEYHEKGYISKVITTNLVYQSPELLSRPYYMEANMTKFLAAIIDCINHDVSTEHVNDPTERIQRLLERMK